MQVRPRQNQPARRHRGAGQNVVAAGPDISGGPNADFDGGRNYKSGGPDLTKAQHPPRSEPGKRYDGIGTRIGDCPQAPLCPVLTLIERLSW